MTESTHDQKSTVQNSSVDRSNDIDSDLITRKVIRAIWIFAAIIDGLLGFRFLLKLFAANAGSPFASLVYATTDFLVYPFHNLVVNPTIGNGVFEITTMIAMLVYIFLTWLVIQLALLIFKR